MISVLTIVLRAMCSKILRFRSFSILELVIRSCQFILVLVYDSMNSKLFHSYKNNSCNLSITSESNMLRLSIKRFFRLWTICNSECSCNLQWIEPRISKYNQNSMRGHLMQALQNKFLSPFPASKVHRKMLSASSLFYWFSNRT